MWEGKEDSPGKKGRSVIPGNKDNRMMGSNQSLGFCAMAFPHNFPVIFWRYTEWKMPSKGDMVGSNWESGKNFRILFLQHLRESRDPPRRWGPAPR